MADRRVRPGRDGTGLPSEPPGRTRSRAHEAVLAGVRHHLAADRWFHRSELFEQGEAAAKNSFRAARFTAPKMFFLAHVAWELALDGALVHEEGPEVVIEGLRSDLEALPEGLLHAVAVDSASPLDAASRQRFERRMTNLWRELLESEWIPGYAHARGLAARALGVRKRLGLEPPDPRQIDRLEDCCEQLLVRARTALPLLSTAPSLGLPLGSGDLHSEVAQTSESSIS